MKKNYYSILYTDSVLQNLEYKIKTYSESESEQANLSNDSIKFRIL